MTQKKMRLGDVIADYSLAIRDINSHTIARYAEEMRLGDQFPAMIVDESSGRLVAGFHRYGAYKTFRDPELTVLVETRKFADEVEMLIFATNDNRVTTLPLTTFERKNIYFRLKKLKVKETILASVLGLSIDKFETWNADTVIVGRDRKPLKRGLKHLRGTKVSAKVYKDMQKHYSGWDLTFHANQIIGHLVNRTIDVGNEQQNKALCELGSLLMEYLSGVNVEVPA